MLFIIIGLAGCNGNWWNRLGYDISNDYVCQQQEPNLPDRVRECKENTMSYEEYRTERAKTLAE